MSMKTLQQIIDSLTRGELVLLCQQAELQCHPLTEYDSSIRDRVCREFALGNIPAHMIVAVWSGK